MGILDEVRIRGRKAIVEFLTSKKAMALVAGAIILIGQRMGIPISEELANQLSLLIGSYILGQGIADAGKAKPTP